MHDHHHHHEAHHQPLSLEERLLKLIEHWVKHNAEHADNYREWAQKARGNHLEKTVSMILEAADLTLDINEKLEQAAAAIREGRNV